MTNPPRPNRPKNDVSDRDRADVLTANSCRYCKDLTGPFEVDHIRPLSRGGTNDRDNLTSACVACNTQKANLLLHEWRQWRTANGMPWPPVASHATDPIHFRDGCQKCLAAGRREWQVTPHRLDPDKNSAAYTGHYQCPQDGSRWTCWNAAQGYFTDCPCAYCVTCRLEAES
ncbi:HNH endonuclease [Streptosporangium canum]|uniref:HNH endonuclease n=1 Tax=Streptosporangium canum TaxID=324952 RepID=UPI003446ED03